MIESIFHSQWAKHSFLQKLIERFSGYFFDNPANNIEIPSALLERAFHDDAFDVELLKDPAYRQDASRAMYRGITRYFAWADGVEPVFLPEPPEALSRHPTGRPRRGAPP